MIEFQSARDGTRIFTWQGKLICSGARPVEEAERWVEKNSDRVRGSRAVVVLGLANGFHAAALARRFPGLRVCVINENEGFLVPSSQILDIQSSLFEVITVADAGELKHATKIQKLMKQSFSVIEFAPAVALNRDFYQQVGELLLGRTHEALQFCLSCRGDDWSGVNVSRVSESRDKQGLKLISYKDIHGPLLESDSSPRSRILGRALMELIR